MRQVFETRIAHRIREHDVLLVGGEAGVELLEVEAVEILPATEETLDEVKVAFTEGGSVTLPIGGEIVLLGWKLD